jgi:hypothetical protein
VCYRVYPHSNHANNGRCADALMRVIGVTLADENSDTNALVVELSTEGLYLSYFLQDEITSA